MEVAVARGAAFVGPMAGAGKLDVDENGVRRILDPTHRPKLDRLERAAKALGGRLEITFVPLA